MTHKKRHPKKNIKHTGGQNDEDREIRMKKAINACQNGMSDAQAARGFNIPESTLRARKKGRTSRQEARASQQALNPQLEAVLCAWAKFFGFMGLPVTKERILAKAPLSGANIIIIPFDVVNLSYRVLGDSVTIE
ncbi:hypothetical protein FS837_000423, partial [Tulasnella sp. UAMH 9824]